MATLNIMGGGFFFAPFTKTEVDGTALLIPGGGLAVYGPWAQVSNPTFRGRWMQLNGRLPNIAGSYQVQLGLGPAGLQAVWQPNSGTLQAFLFSADIALNEPPQMYTFPISLDAGQALWARGSFAGAPTVFNLVVSIWG